MNLQKATPWVAWIGHTAAGYATLLTLFWLPLGLHRIVMRKPTWWHFPASFLVGLIGLAGWHYMPSQLWVLAAAPYMGLFARDFWTLWLWAWPLDETPLDHLRSLNARYELSGHLTMGIIVFVLLVLVVGKK